MSEVVDIHRLLAASNLEMISFLELSAKRNNEGAGYDSVMPDGDEYEVKPEFTLEVGRGEENDKFRIRIRTDIDAEPGVITVDAAAEYTLDGLKLSEVTGPLMLEFVNRVAVLALIPFLRQGVADMTLRVFGTPLTMPMYRAGDLAFSELGGTDE